LIMPHSFFLSPCVVILIAIMIITVIDNAARRYSADRMGSTHGLDARAGRALRFTHLC